MGYKKGELHLIIGGMFSGKTTELIRTCDKYKYINKKILYINSETDSRSKSCFGNLKSHNLGYISSHDDKSVQCIKISDISEILSTNIYEDFDVLGIDEAQFFPDLMPILTLVNKYNKIVIVSGLNGDYQQNIFGKIFDLIPHCDTLCKLNALCVHCNNGTPAIFSKRICENKDQELVGGNSKYVAVCRYHMYC